MSLLQGFETMRLVKVGPSLRERLERWIAEQHHKAVIDRLRRFREGLERDMQPESWTDLEASMVLLLSDVCDALGLTEDERASVLGQEGTRALDEDLEVRFQPVCQPTPPLNERQEKAMAFARENGVIDLSTYRKLCPHWSNETLRLDLLNLVRRGLLARNGANKGTYYTLAE
jgi:predicted HTH transcriptional regulator